MASKLTEPLFQLAAQLKGQEISKQKHEAAMRRYTQDWEGTKLDLQIKRQTIQKNKQDALKAQRTAVQTQILSSKTSASQVIALGRQAIQDIKDSTGNNTEYTKDQQQDLKEARSQISIGNNLLADALTQEAGFNKPQTPPQQLAMLKQKFYAGLDRQSANITTSPLNQSNQNEIARIDALVKPDRRAAWVQAQSSGSMATIRGFGAEQNNVFNPVEMSNARSTAAALLAVRPQVFAQGDIKAQNAWTGALLDAVGTMSPDLGLQTKIKESIFGDSLKIQPGEQKPAAPAAGKGSPSTPDAVSGSAGPRRGRPVQFNKPTQGPPPQNPNSRALGTPTAPAQDLKKLSNDELFQQLLNSRIKK